MVQFGPVDLFWYTTTNLSTSKTFTLTFCARKWNAEKCLGSAQETYGVSCKNLNQCQGRDSFLPAELAPGEVSYGNFTFLNFCIFFPLSVSECQWKVRDVIKLQRNLNPPVRRRQSLTDLLGAKWLLGLWWQRVDRTDSSGMGMLVLMCSPKWI